MEQVQIGQMDDQSVNKKFRIILITKLNCLVGERLKWRDFLLDQDQGFYLQKVTGVSAIDEIIDQDPAIQNGTFGIVEKEPIALQIEQPLPTPDSTRMPGFIIEYTPGINWAQGKPIWAQSLEAHQQYVVELFQASTLYRGAQYLERG